MHPKRQQRLYIVLFVVVVASLGISLVLYLLEQNKNFFYSPTDFLSADIDKDSTIRVGGCVVYGSIERSGDNLDMTFDITDGSNQVTVRFDKIVPDLFAEGEAAVAIGRAVDGQVVATDVLAKHDENYMPPEVSSSLQNQDINMKSCQAMFAQ